MKSKNKKILTRSTTRQTVLMVEKCIDENSGEFKKTELFNNLPKKMMWQTFQVIMDYLERNVKIVYDREGYIVYIWNPEFYEKIIWHLIEKQGYICCNFDNRVYYNIDDYISGKISVTKLKKEVKNIKLE